MTALDADKDSRVIAHPTAGQTGPCRLIEPTADGSYAAFARAIVQGRRRIGQFFRPDLFGDPAFDMMLELFAAASDGLKVKVTSLAPVARVPQTTGLRYLAALEKEGLVERYAHPHDKRITFVRLTETAQATMRRYLENISAIAFES